MKRLLRRGGVYRTKEGVIYERMVDGTVFRGTSKRRDPYPGDPLFDITPEQFRRDPSAWVPTAEELAAGRTARIAQEKQWHATRRIEPSEGLLKMLAAAPENKMVTAPGEKQPEEPAKGPPGRPARMVTK